MIHTPQRKPEMEMPLCSFCASFYYENKKYWIERSDSKQKKLDVCMICRNRHGYDFKIWNLHKRYSSKRIIDKEVHHGLESAFGGAILFSLIVGIACVVYTVDNQSE